MTLETCPFCKNKEPRLASNDFAFAILDRSPISTGHALIVSRSHVPTIFDLSSSEYAACFELMHEVKELLSREHGAESFHVVVNSGPDADQTVSHAHIHLVPRYPGKPLLSPPHPWSSIR